MLGGCPIVHLTLAVCTVWFTSPKSNRMLTTGSPAPTPNFCLIGCPVRRLVDPLVAFALQLISAGFSLG